MPSALARQTLACVGRIDGANRLGRCFEGGIRRRHLGTGQEGHDLAAVEMRLELLCDEVADRTLGLRTEGVEGHGRRPGKRLGLQCKQSDLRAVAVRDHELVAARELGERQRRVGHSRALTFDLRRLAARRQRVAPECDDDSCHHRLDRVVHSPRAH